MKTLLKFFVIILCSVILYGCSKNSETPVSKEEQIAKYLTGDFNRVWNLREVYQQGVLQPLTDAQRKYTKTYTINPGEAKRGKFTNSDGYMGDWKVLNEFQLFEEFTNNPRGPLPLQYEINFIDDKKLDIHYTANFIKTREVYHAY